MNKLSNLVHWLPIKQSILCRCLCQRLNKIFIAFFQYFRVIFLYSESAQNYFGVFLKTFGRTSILICNQYIFVTRVSNFVVEKLVLIEISDVNLSLVAQIERYFWKKLGLFLKIDELSHHHALVVFFLDFICIDRKRF